MNIEFSIKSKKFYEFLCVFNPAYLEAHRHKFYETDYIKVYISYELDDNKKVLQKHFLISKDTKEKNIPRFINFPPEIQKMMVEKSSSKSCIPFLNYSSVGTSSGGFDWYDTEEGDNFWREIINKNNFAVFYKKYPLISDTCISKNLIAACDSIINCSSNENMINEILNRVNQLTETLTKKEKENEKNQLQRKEVPERREHTGTSRVLRGTDKIRVAIGHLGYQKIIIRG